MANNIDVTPGTGKTVATEEIASTQYQQIKLIDATAASTTPTGVAANPLQVSLANTSANATAVKVDGSAVTQPVSGSVSLSAVVPGTGATNLGKAEDAAHSSGDVGVFALAVQKASPADLAADGDYAALEVSGGRLWTSATIDAALPAGANAIGKLAANSGVDIGDVDVTTVGTITPGTAATNLGKAEDAAHSSGDVGVFALAIQKGTPADIATEGDYAGLQMSAGRLWVDPSGVTLTVASHAVTNAGTFAVQTTAQVPGTGATNLGKAEDAVAGSGDTGVMALAVRSDTAAATGADGDYVPLLTDSTGRLHANVSNTVTVASHAVTNAGTFAVQESGTQVQVDDAAFTPATSKIVMAGFEADESSTDSVDEGDGGAARITLDRKQIVAAYPHTAGGCLIANMTSGDTFTALTNSAQAIKASAGQLYGWYIYNPNATAAYVNIYNVASGSVTVGTTTPAMNIVIPATSAANILGAVGIEFTNAGFSASATTTGGGNTAPGTALEANFFYK